MDEFEKESTKALDITTRPGYKCHPRGRCKTRPVIDLLRFVSGLAADLVRRRVELVAENALLRQQLIVAKRKLAGRVRWTPWRSEEHTSELQSLAYLVCRLLLEKKKKIRIEISKQMLHMVSR